MKDDYDGKLPSFAELLLEVKSGPLWFGVDWAEGSGKNRGEVISRQDNVVHVRFKTVE